VTCLGEILDYIDQKGLGLALPHSTLSTQEMPGVIQAADMSQYLGSEMHLSGMQESQTLPQELSEATTGLEKL